MEIKILNFVSKVKNLDEDIKRLKKGRYIEKEKVAIIKTITLPAKDFKKFIEDFFVEQPFLDNTCKWLEKEKVFTGIRVTDGVTNIIVETQGYKYARYTAIEKA